MTERVFLPSSSVQKERKMHSNSYAHHPDKHIAKSVFQSTRTTCKNWKGFVRWITRCQDPFSLIQLVRCVSINFHPIRQDLYRIAPAYRKMRPAFHLQPWLLFQPFFFLLYANVQFYHFFLLFSWKKKAPPVKLQLLAKHDFHVWNELT